MKELFTYTDFISYTVYLLPYLSRTLLATQLIYYLHRSYLLKELFTYTAYTYTDLISYTAYLFPYLLPY